jgi:hypothetical protein
MMRAGGIGNKANRLAMACPTIPPPPHNMTLVFDSKRAAIVKEKGEMQQ